MRTGWHTSQDCYPYHSQISKNAPNVESLINAGNADYAPLQIIQMSEARTEASFPTLQLNLQEFPREPDKHLTMKKKNTVISLRSFDAMPQ